VSINNGTHRGNDRATERFLKRSPITLWAPALLLIVSIISPAHANESLVRIATIAVPSATAARPFVDFDIAYVDPAIDELLVANVSNKSLDVFRASSRAFVLSVGGFAGSHPPPGWSLNGPSSVETVPTSAGVQAWASDGDSLVKIIDLHSGKVLDTISTGGTKRADEMCYDRRDQIIVVNNADEPTPFSTFISTKNGHVILGKLPFPNATDGLEQPVWSAVTGNIYLAIPEIDHADGGVAIIEPKSRTILKIIRTEGCHPNGAALGSDEHLLLGCRQPGVTKSTSKELSRGAVMLDMRTGKKITRFPSLVASDELAYNAGDKRFYVSAYGNPSGPVVAGVDSAVPGRPIVTASTGDLAHSVAADPRTNHIFVPLRPNAKDPSCQYGCIGVYAVTSAQ